jgi:DAACS family dicarboxylate/amino acid:cation (Na+ or H+) symporter
MLIGLVAGAVLGGLANAVLGADSEFLNGFIRYITEPAGKIFLRLLFMLVIPLIFCALSLGVAGLGDLKKLGRIGVRTLVYTAAVSAAAVLIGVGLVNAFRPGATVGGEMADRLQAGAGVPAPAAGQAPSGVDFLVNLVPANAVRAMADGDMLAVMVFSLFLGVGLVATRNEATKKLEETLEGFNQVIMRLLAIVIELAPLGVACLIFTLTARMGYDILRQLSAYVLVVVAGLLIQQFIVYGLSVRLLGGMNPLQFFRAVRPAMLTAFSTASSNATLPTTLLVADRDLGLPKHVSRFVLTLGSTANQNGTALFEGVTVLFLAQFYGIDLALSQQLLVVFICVLGGIGTAGVPAGSIPVVVMIMGMVGVPAEGIGLILGVDRFLDMCRTTINVTGDLAAAVVVSRGEPRASVGHEAAATSAD